MDEDENPVLGRVEISLLGGSAVGAALFGGLSVAELLPLLYLIAAGAVPGGAVAAGLFLALKPKRKSGLALQLKAARESTATISNLAYHVQRPKLKNQLERIAQLGKVLEKRIPTAVDPFGKALLLARSLASVVDIMNRFEKAYSMQAIGEVEAVRALGRDLEDNILPAIQQGLTSLGRNLQRENIADIEPPIRVAISRLQLHGVLNEEDSE